MSNKTNAAIEPGTAYPSGAHGFTQILNVLFSFRTIVFFLILTISFPSIYGLWLVFLVFKTFITKGAVMVNYHFFLNAIITSYVYDLVEAGLQLMIPGYLKGTKNGTRSRGYHNKTRIEKHRYTTWKAVIVVRGIQTQPEKGIQKRQTSIHPIDIYMNAQSHDLVELLKKVTG